MSQPIATVVAVIGKAFARSQDGAQRELKPGDVLLEGETVITGPGAHVELALGNGELLDVLAEQTVVLTAEVSSETQPASDEASLAGTTAATVIRALESGADLNEEIEAPAAGTDGGGSGEGNSFVRLLRVAEDLDPLAFDFGTALGAQQDTFDGGAGDERPTAADDLASTPPQTPVTIDVLANDRDPDGNVLSIVAVAGEAISVGNPVSFDEGSVALNPDGTLTFMPDANVEGPVVFAYTITDGVNQVTAQVTVSVAEAGDDTPVVPTPADDVPVAVDDTASVAEGQTLAGDLAANDTESDDGGNVWALDEAPTSGVAVVNADGTYTYTPGAGFTGTDSFTYTISDADGDVSTATVTITVEADATPGDDDDSPVAIDDVVTTAEGVAAAGTLADNDSPSDDGGNLWALDQAASNGVAVVNADGTYSYTPNAGFTGTDSFTYTITDADGDVSTATVTVTVTPDTPPPGGDDVPVAADDAFVVDSGAVLNADLSTNDTPSADGGNIWALAQPAGGGAVVVNSDGSFSYTPDPGFLGIDSFTYTITDTDGDVSTAQVIIDVGGDPEPPVAVADNATTAEDTPVTISILGNDSDPDGTLDPSTVSIVAGPSNGTLVVNADGSVDYTPNANYNGPDSFTYTVQDDEGNTSNVATVNLTIDNTQEPPVAVDDSATTAEDTAVTINVLANDSDPDGALVPGTVTIAGQPSNGTVVVNADGTVTYTPDANYNGADSFSYTVTDDEGNVSNVATVNLTIDNTQEPPVAVDDSATTAEDTAVTINVLANDSDPDGALVPGTVTIAGQPATARWSSMPTAP